MLSPGTMAKDWLLIDAILAPAASDLEVVIDSVTMMRLIFSYVAFK